MYKGMTIENKEWVSGFLWMWNRDPDVSYITLENQKARAYRANHQLSTTAYRVDGETLCMETRYKDVGNAKSVWTNDIVEVKEVETGKDIAFGVVRLVKGIPSVRDLKTGEIIQLSDAHPLLVVGNIFDDPDILSNYVLGSPNAIHTVAFNYEWNILKTIDKLAATRNKCRFQADTEQYKEMASMLGDIIVQAQHFKDWIGMVGQFKEKIVSIATDFGEAIIL